MVCWTIGILFVKGNRSSLAVYPPLPWQKTLVLYILSSEEIRWFLHVGFPSSESITRLAFVAALWQCTLHVEAIYRKLIKEEEEKNPKNNDCNFEEKRDGRALLRA